MRKPLRSALVVGFTLALWAAGIAAAEKPVIVEAGGLLPIVNGGFAPKALPKKGKPAPVALHLSAKADNADASVPLALREMSLELDRHITADAEGMAICPLGNVESPPPEERCRSALLGKGLMNVLVEFPEQAPFIVGSKLFAFNAGGKRGRLKILLRAYLPAPVSAAVLIPITVTKIDRGRFGTKWLFAFPKIAGGYGAITEFSLDIGRRFHYLGEERSYLLGRCPDGHLDGRGVSVFADGLTEAGSFVRSCTPKP